MFYFTLHSTSNLLIAACYGSISLLLASLAVGSPYRNLKAIFFILILAFSTCGIGHFLASQYSEFLSYWHVVMVFASSIPAIGGWYLRNKILDTLETAKNTEKLALSLGALSKAARHPQAIVQFTDEDEPICIWSNQAANMFAIRFGNPPSTGLIGENWYKVFAVKTRWKADHKMALTGKTLSNDEDFWEEHQTYISWQIKKIDEIPKALLFEFQDVTEPMMLRKRYQNQNEVFIRSNLSSDLADLLLDSEKNINDG